MHENHDLNRFAHEIASLESETFEIADYADTNVMFAAVISCATSCSATSTVSG